jgi:hypothetical protein
MALGEALVVEGRVSARLLERVESISAIYQAWGRGLAPAAVVAEPVEAPQPVPGTEVGLSFTAGVDSFYTLLKDMSRNPSPHGISRLLFIAGFDMECGDTRRRRAVEASVVRVADKTGKRPVLAATNLRALTGRWVDWELHHGAAIASTALALGGLLRKCVIASSWSYRDLRPWGSHPLLDPLWSTEQVEFFHDGCEVVRNEKVTSISSSALALSALRVCWENRNEHYNCGECGKCISTMAMLRAAGVRDMPTFPRPFSLDLLRALDMRPPARIVEFTNLLDTLERTGADPQLAASVGRALRRGRLRGALHDLGDTVLPECCRATLGQDGGVVRRARRLAAGRTARALAAGARRAPPKRSAARPGR